MAGTRSSLHTTHHHIPHPTPPSSGNTHFTSSSGIIGITGSSGITSSAGSSSGSDSSGNYRRDKFSCEREVSSLASSSSVTSSPSSALHQSSSSYSESSMSEEDVPTAEECAVFVTDIARGVTDEMLKEKFAQFGAVYDAFVVKNKFTGDTKGYGFVKFQSMDDVYTCLDAKELPRFEDNVSHKMYVDILVKVTMADPKDTLLVVNIPRGWSEEDTVAKLTELTTEAPRKFRYSGANKATGYASYQDHEQALRCLKNIQRPPAGVAAPPFTAYLAPPKQFDAKNAPSMRALFVRGTSGLTSEMLRDLFGGSEVVERAIVPTDTHKGGPLGHAFIHFFSTKAAASAKEKFHGYDHEGTRLTIEWCLPKNAKKPNAANLPPAPAPYSNYPYQYPYPPYPYYSDYDAGYYPPPYPPSYDPYYGGEEPPYRGPGPNRRYQDPYYQYPNSNPRYPTSHPPPTHTSAHQQSYPNPYPAPYAKHSSYAPPNYSGERGSRGSNSSSRGGSRFTPY